MVDPESKQLWQELRLFVKSDRLKEAIEQDTMCCFVMKQFGPDLKVYSASGRELTMGNNFCPHCGRKLW